MTQVVRWLEKSFASGDEEREFLHYVFDRVRSAVIPADDAFRGVASTDEGDLGIGLAQFACDFDEQSSVGPFDAVASARRLQHLDTLFERGSVKLFVGIGAGDDADNFIDYS